METRKLGGRDKGSDCVSGSCEARLGREVFHTPAAVAETLGRAGAAGV